MPRLEPCDSTIYQLLDDWHVGKLAQDDTYVRLWQTLFLTPLSSSSFHKQALSSHAQTVVESTEHAATPIYICPQTLAIRPGEGATWPQTYSGCARYPSNKNKTTHTMFELVTEWEQTDTETRVQACSLSDVNVYTVKSRQTSRDRPATLFTSSRVLPAGAKALIVGSCQKAGAWLGPLIVVRPAINSRQQKHSLTISVIEAKKLAIGRTDLNLVNSLTPQSIATRIVSRPGKIVKSNTRCNFLTKLSFIHKQKMSIYNTQNTVIYTAINKRTLVKI